MWQVLLAAAVAGSGFLANRFLNPGSDPDIVSAESAAKCDEFKEQQQQQLGSVTVGDDDGEGSVFRFSSSGPQAGYVGSRFGSKNGRKNSVNGHGGNGGKPADGFESIGVGNTGKKSGVADRSGRKFAFCVKKRRTSRNGPGKCESCSSKDNSFFNWGLGVGLMYMMSSGKAEIGRLNTAMDETAKVVQELKNELHKRKSSRDLQFSSSKSEASANPNKINSRYTQQILQSSTENRDNFRRCGILVTEEGECTSSVLTEEPQQEVQEMDRLEAELESELQKIPWCSTEASGLEGRISDFYANDAFVEGFCQPDGQTTDPYQSSGVLPSELDQKLSHLLIEQQESQIVELESELHQSHSKLYEKEAELQALKECVRRLTEFSLATVEDEETEAHLEEEKMKDGNSVKEMVSESQKSMIGMKRAMDFELYSCRVK